jgi:DNA-binding transcriptional LysR family regulator
MPTTSSAAVLRRRLATKSRLRHLEVLVAVAELGSVHRAAEKISLSQPGVTKHLHDLELLLETPLFLRHARGMKLTPAGEQLVPLARRILRGLDDVAEQTAALAGRARGMVRVVSSQGGISRLLAEAVPSFQRASPGIMVTVRETDPLSLGSHLSQGDADLAVCREPELPAQGWVFTPLLPDRLVVVAGPAHPLARRRSPVDRATLAAQTWLSASLQSRAQIGLQALFEGLPQPAQCRVLARSPVMLWSLLRGGEVLALIPASYLHEFLVQGLLTEIRTGIDMPLSPIGMLMPERPTPSARQFADHLEAMCRDPIAPR